MHCYILNIVSEDFLKVFPHYKGANNRPLGHSQVGPKEHSWHDLCRGPQYIALY